MAVYLDNNATTPLDPRVRAAMNSWLGERYGNPSSVHRFGQAAREAVEAARDQIAVAIGARTANVFFTSSGTEANNAVVLGRARTEGPRRIVVSGLEHPSIQRSCSVLESRGWEVARVPPESSGVVAPEGFSAALTADTSLACLMLANNEVGTVQPVREVARQCRHIGVPLLCDAVQAIGKIAVDVNELGVDYLVVGGHKFHGPLGAAALWARQPAQLEPFLVGGGQERGRRAGTENVPAIVGLGVAAELAVRELAKRRQHLAALRDAFERGVERCGEVAIHAADAPRLPNTSNVAFRGVLAENLMIRLDLAGIAVSAGAACSSGKVESSSTLRAMGVSRAEALASIRVSFGMTNVRGDVECLLRALEKALEELNRGVQR